jgi:hypothetical protein
MKKITLAIAAMACFMAGSTQAAIVTHSTDFIADATRSHFNGFEAIPNDGIHYTGGSGAYSEGGISVLQGNPDAGNTIWINYRPTGVTGNHAWYPDGGDHGYTQITMSDSSDFSDVGFAVSSGGGANTVFFELFNNGGLVMSGSSAMASHYLGFSGGGFDMIRLTDNCCGATNVSGGGYQALVVDSIETAGAAVPEPASVAIFGIAGLGLALARRRKQK